MKQNQRKQNETKRNETKSTKTKRNKTKPTKAKWNQQKQNEIDWYEENGRKQNRGLKEIQTNFTITMLDYFPHISVFHQERTGFDHHWTRILCVYSTGVCPFYLVASFKFGNHKSNANSVERRGIKKKRQSPLIDTYVWGKLNSVSKRRKSVTTRRTNERTDSRSPIYPDLFWRGMKILIIL
jgi:hypothetical protein